MYLHNFKMKISLCVFHLDVLHIATENGLFLLRMTKMSLEKMLKGNGKTLSVLGCSKR